MASAADPWDATALGAPGQGTEGAGSAERGVRVPVGPAAPAGPAPPVPPANTPLQEQVYQTQYRNQHNQVQYRELVFGTLYQVYVFL